MKCETVNVGDPPGDCYMFYSVPALLLDHDREREFGTIIAEAKNKLIVVDDETLREHVYLIPKTKVADYSQNQVYFRIPDYSLKDFEM
jgi:hypothetical protein